MHLRGKNSEQKKMFFFYYKTNKLTYFVVKLKSLQHLNKMVRRFNKIKAPDPILFLIIILKSEFLLY